MKNRTHLTRELAGLVTTALLLASIAGCKSDSENTQVPPGGGSGGSSTGFTFDTTDMYVDFKADSTEKVYMHLDGDWTKPCKIAQANRGSDIACVIEVSEFDVYTQGMGLVYNVPKEQCDYGLLTPYYFYDWQPKYGPSSVSVTVDSNGNMTVTGQTPAGSSSIGNIFTNAGALYCDGDHSPAQGPNCCEGQYVLTTTTLDASSAVVSVTTSFADWGGKISNCIQGPGADTQPKDAAGYPERTVFIMNGQTVHDTYDISSPMKQARGTNIYVANYFTGPPYAGASAVFPTPLKPPTAIYQFQYQPWYELGCVDHSEDYYNRIRVLIRAWSADSEFVKQGSGDPSFYNATGFEGAPFDDQPQVDRWGWPKNSNGDGWGNTYPTGN